MAMPDRAIIGQYWPEDSLVHAMDPRVKFILSFVLMAAVFCAATPLSLAVAALFIVATAAAASAARKNARIWKQGISPGWVRSNSRPMASATPMPP